MDNADYFNQPDVWADVAHEYQVQVGKDVAQLIPSDVQSVLDVGCGNGLITKELGSGYKVIGVDQSAVALGDSNTPVAQADAGRLPFADSCFDLVLTTDMLEHVGPLHEVTAELVRVSRKYLLITVPFAEDLPSKMSICESCGTSFHINHHLRTFDLGLMQELEMLIGPLVEMRLSGGTGKPPLDKLAHLRHAAGCYMDWPASKCPTCGAPGSAGSASDVQRSMLNSLRAEAWAERLQDQGICEDRSEVMCLFAISQAVRDELELAPSSDVPKVLQKNLCEVYFDTVSQAGEFVAGAQYARQCLLRSASGLVGPVYQVSFPLPLNVGDVVRLTLAHAGQVKIFAVDGVLGAKTQLTPLPGSGQDNTQCFQVSENIACSQFGGLIELEFAVGGRPLSCELQPKNTKGLVGDFVRLNPGSNIVTLQHEQRRFSWSMCCESALEYPDPMAMLVRLRDSYATPADLPIDEDLEKIDEKRELMPMLQVIDSLATRVAKVSRIANDIEEQRSDLEDTIQKRDQEIAIAHTDVQRWISQAEGVNDAANRLEQQRAALDEALLANKALLNSQAQQFQEELNQHKREIAVFQAKYVDGQKALESVQQELSVALENEKILGEMVRSKDQFIEELEAKRASLEELVEAKDSSLSELERVYNELMVKTK